MAAKILLVDENKYRRDFVRLILKSNNYLVVERADCESALSLLARMEFDLILLDITLPDKNGSQVLEFLKVNHLATKVIVITGTAGLENTIKNTTLGAREYISKPYEPDSLLRAIEHILSERSQTGLKIQIIKVGDFLRSTPTGDLDMKASKLGLAQIAATGAELQGYKVLIDLRDVQSKLSTPDIYELASELGEYNETFRRKTALLTRVDGHLDQAAFFEKAARSQGFDVRTFTVFEDAVVWLSSIIEATKEQ